MGGQCRAVTELVLPSLEVGLDDDTVSVRIDDAEDFFYVTCDGAFRLLKLREGEPLALVDRRPWSTNGAHFVDGERQDYVFPGEGCDVISCEPLAGRSLSRVEYVLAEEPLPVSQNPDGLPELSTRLAGPPLQVEVDYYATADCAGTAQTARAEPAVAGTE